MVQIRLEVHGIRITGGSCVITLHRNSASFFDNISCINHIYLFIYLIYHRRGLFHSIKLQSPLTSATVLLYLNSKYQLTIRHFYRVNLLFAEMQNQSKDFEQHSLSFWQFRR